ncbi:hypothetical protein PG993_001114 [Apiospora rasikravindrae]|uniref:Clr5 domain-containing protein n=1 Tax=Apiospora rasikravindrae TaxID=990691 RepID=A0ABR1UAF9_9PEZI
MQPDNPVPFRTFRVLAPTPAPSRSLPDANPRTSDVSTRWEHYGEETWHAMYPHIRRLYLEEGCKLDEVMKYMEVHFSFRPTFRKYRVRQDESRSATPREHPTQPGSTTGATKSLVSPTKSHLIDLPVLPIQPSPLPSHQANLRYLTKVRDWATSYFDHGQPAQETSLEPRAPHLAAEFVNTSFKLVDELLQRGHGQLAGRVARQAFTRVEDLFCGETPVLLMNLSELIYTIAAREQLRLFALFVNYLLSLAEAKYGYGHPLVQIMASLQKAAADEVDLSALLEQGALVGSNVICIKVDPHDRVLLSGVIWDSGSIQYPAQLMMPAMTGFVRTLRADPTVDPADGLVALWKEKVRDYKKSPGILDTPTLQLLAETEITDSYTAFRLSSPLLTGESLLRSSSPSTDNNAEATLLHAQGAAHANELGASVDEREGALDAAVAKTARAVKLREYVHGRYAIKTVLSMFRLERILRLSGRVEGAAKARRDAIQRTSGLLGDIPGDV